MTATNQYSELARDAWNEAAPIHWRSTNKLIDELADPSTIYLAPSHVHELQRCGLSGKTVAQLNCNNGRELISMVRLGARHGTGFDISTEFITQARELANAAGASCEFVCTDVYEIPSAHDGQYDLVVVTAGALCFMSDLQRYLGVAKRLLRIGGRLNMYECHPIAR
jgi:SAM-dependent methyltransferase